MDLSRFGRDFYVQEITTDPTVDAWDASFDEGETWVAGDPVPGVDNRWRWLVRGPDFDVDGNAAAASSLIAEDFMQPLLRATDVPTVPVTRGTLITLMP